MHLKSSSFKCDKESKMHSNISLTLTCTFYLENIVVVWKTERKNVLPLQKNVRMIAEGNFLSKVS